MRKMDTQYSKKSGIKHNPNLNQGAKKISIKNFKAKPILPSNYKEETIAKLEDAVVAIYEQRAIASTLEELYNAVKNLCAHQLSSDLYDRLRRTCEAHVKLVINQFQSEDMDQHFMFLKKMDHLWEAHCDQMTMIRSIFIYLDRGYVLQNSTILSIWDVGLQLWCSHIMEKEVIKNKTIQALLHFINKERNGEAVDTILLKRMIRMLADLQMYKSTFEPAFLQESRSLFAEEGKRCINELDVPNYLKRVERRLHEETHRYYLEVHTRFPLINLVEEELIQNYVFHLLEKGFTSLVEGGEESTLHLMYTLLKRVKPGRKQQSELVEGGLVSMRKYFAEYIKDHGLKIVQDKKKDKHMVQELLAFKETLNSLIENVFHNDKDFVDAIKGSFDYFINKRKDKPAELLAKYVDAKLRTGNKESSESDFEKTLNKIMIIFRFINGKDVFEEFYKRDLAKRLLLGRSASVDSEQSMLIKLKRECGPGYTQKLEKMFKDIELSKDIMNTYKQTDDSVMNVSVLTTGCWPTYEEVTHLNIPPQMASLQEDFRMFYINRHNGRALHWKNSLSTCDVLSRFPQGTKELRVSLLQLLCLLHFNEKDVVTFKELSTVTGIEEVGLKRTLQSLSVGLVRVLKKSSQGKDVLNEDKFKFNEKFFHKLYKIKINQIQHKETKEENTETHEQVFENRKCLVDCAIVRTLKMRKKIDHNDLLTELVKQLKFPLTAADIKKRIETLIQREYLERDKDDQKLYHYLA